MLPIYWGSKVKEEQNPKLRESFHCSKTYLGLVEWMLAKQKQKQNQKPFKSNLKREQNVVNQGSKSTCETALFLSSKGIENWIELLLLHLSNSNWDRGEKRVFYRIRRESRKILPVFGANRSCGQNWSHHWTWWNETSRQFFSQKNSLLWVIFL